MTKLNLDPAIDNLRRQAEAAFVERRFAACLPLAKKLLQLLPNDPQLSCRLGMVYRKLKRVRESLQPLQNAITQAGEADHYYQLGLSYQALGELPQALQQFEQAARLKPRNPDYPGAMGGIYLLQNKLDKAAAYFEQAVSRDNQNINAQYHLAYCYQLSGRLNAAITHYQHVLNINDAHLPALNNLGALYKIKNKLPQAVLCYQTLLSRKPENAGAWNNMGVILQQQGNSEQAIQAFEKAVAYKPGFARAYNNLGACLLDTHCYQPAIDSFNKVLQLKPNDTEAIMNIGRVYLEMLNFEQAERYYRRAIHGNPQLAMPHWHLSLLLLVKGDIADGWLEYHWGLYAMEHGKPVRINPAFPVPLWHGTDLSKRTIAVCAEQGLGDELLFASCLPDLIQQAKHCIIECEPRLKQLYQRSFPQAEIRDRFTRRIQSDPALTGVDYCVPAGTLPRYLRKSLADFPASGGFLQADPDLLQGWQNRLAVCGPALKVGISWRSMRHVAAELSGKPIQWYTRLEQWAPVFNIPDIAFINLQYDSANEEIERTSKAFNVNIRQWPDLDLQQNLDSVAGLISALDLVIAPANSVAFLAAALGKPVWLLEVTRGWPYLGTDHYPWFPNIRPFLRDRCDNDWSTLLASMAVALRNLRKQSQS